MKLRLLTLATLFTMVSAHAEVRPILPGGGEILDTFCGSLNRSVELCIAQAQNSDKKYIVLKHFLKGMTYVPVEEETLRAAGANNSVLKGRAAVAIEGSTTKGMREDTYELRLVQVIRPGVKPKATLKINGVQSGIQVEMDRISHTE